MPERAWKEKSLDIAERVALKKGDSLALRSGTYKVKGKLGHGGAGSVYLIVDNSDRKFAIKILDLWRTSPTNQNGLVDRFKSEYNTGLVRSPYIVRSFGRGVIEGNPYIIMEYCSGGNLIDRRDDFYPEEKFTPLALQILDGLHKLHVNDYVHRDIKPENILLCDDVAKLSDMGIVANIKKRQTQMYWMGKAKEVWGTLHYAPPEQLSYKGAVKKILPAADVFGFGVTLFELISGGHSPFNITLGEKATEVDYYKKLIKSQPKSILQYRTDIPKYWDQLLNKCLQPELHKRYADTREVKNIVLSHWSRHFSDLPSSKTSEIIYEYTIDEHYVKKFRPFDLQGILKRNQNRIITIGRVDEDGVVNNDIEMDNNVYSFLSRAHATLEFDDFKWHVRNGQYDFTEGTWRLSRNGVQVNGVEVDSQSGRELRNGDKLVFGDLTMIYRSKLAT